MTALTVATAFTLPVISVAAQASAAAATITAASADEPGGAPGSAPGGAPARASEWWLTALGVSRAWQAAAGRGGGVTVAVLSTGVDATQPDLAGDVTAGPDLSRSGRGSGGPFWGYEGTAVASLIAGHGHGRGGTAGITGVAPRAKILSLRVTLEYNDPLNARAAITNRLPDAIAAGIRYAVSRGVQVIALPLDPGALGPSATGDPAAGGGSPAERAAVTFALAHNVLLVAPAGDNGASTGSVTYPAAYPGVIAAGATGRDGRLTPYTSTRSYVALTAPGANLREAAPGRGYDALSSSDMSAALTAGAAALIRSRYPRLTAAQVAQALLRGAGHGALNAATAVAAAAAVAGTLPGPARGGQGTSGAGAAPQGGSGGSGSTATHQGGAGTIAGS
ncbi:MAG TPA: S8 family serine peptidase, partial [Trebonia sp.]|nr:S8 family serine peptidase [Trebonia sp.]